MLRLLTFACLICTTLSAPLSAQENSDPWAEVFALFQEKRFEEALAATDAILASLPGQDADGDNWPDKAWQDATFLKARILQELGRCGEAVNLAGYGQVPAYQKQALYMTGLCQQSLGNWLSAMNTWQSLDHLLSLDIVEDAPGERESVQLLQSFAEARWSGNEAKRRAVVERADAALERLGALGTRAVPQDRLRFNIDLLFGRSLQARYGLESLLPNASPEWRMKLLTDLVRIDASSGFWTSVSDLTEEALTFAPEGTPEHAELIGYQLVAAASLGMLDAEESLIAAEAAFTNMAQAQPVHVTNLVRAVFLLNHFLPFLEKPEDVQAISALITPEFWTAFEDDNQWQLALYQFTNRMAKKLVDTAGPEPSVAVLKQADALLKSGGGFRGWDAQAELKLEEFRAIISVRRAQGLPDDTAPDGAYSTRDLQRVMGKIADEDLLRTPTELALAERNKRAGYRQIFEDAIAATYADMLDRLHLWRERGYAYLPNSGETPEGYGISELAKEHYALAFGFSQSARLTEAGRAMLSTMARIGEGNSTLARLLRERDTLLEARLVVENGTGEDARQERARIDVELMALRESMRVENPEFEQLLQPRALGPADVQKALSPDEAVLKYVVTDDALFAFLVTSDGMGLHQATLSGAELGALVDTLRAGLDPSSTTRAAAALDDENSLSNAPPPFDFAAATTLYRHLIAPHLPYLDGVHTLHVIPDGPLLSIPFSMLVTQWDGADPQSYEDYGQIRWAIRDHAYSTLPILSALPLLKRAPQPAAKPFIGIGDPILEGDGNPVFLLRGNSADLSDLRNLAPLPETDGELRQLNRLVADGAGRLFLRETAREPLLTDATLSDTRVIAFATHGLLGGDLTGLNEPALVLTPPETAGPKDDGLLSASEIAELDLQAEWVILSACNTAAGDGADSAEGLSGLARSFLYAGSQGLLASHWPIQSDAAVALTTGMFDHLDGSEDASGAQALRASMLRMIDTPARSNWQHPAAWAPFVVIGR